MLEVGESYLLVNDGNTRE